MKKLCLLLCLAALPAASYAGSGVFVRGSYDIIKFKGVSGLDKLPAYGGNVGVKISEAGLGAFVAELGYLTGSKYSKSSDKLRFKLDNAWQLRVGLQSALGSDVLYFSSFSSIFFYKYMSEELRGKEISKQSESGNDWLLGMGFGLNLGQHVNIEANSTVLGKPQVIEFSLAYTF